MKYCRRSFIAGLGALAASALLKPAIPAFAAENPFETYTDPVTGATVHMLTNNDHQDQTVYQTHPQWTQDQSRFMYNSQRDGGWVPVLLDMRTGECRALAPATTNSVLDVRNNRLLYIQGRDLFGIPFTLDAADPIKLATLPEEVLGSSGGVFIDAVKPIVYMGATKEKDVRWALMACNLGDGSWSTVCDLDFQIGHVQANPLKSGEVMFCHETGGDAPQRTWLVEVGGEPRPAYKETYDEWVTHEAWWGKDEIVFTVWPYDEKHTDLAHGIFSANVRDGKLTQHAQYKAWHTQASHDRQWIVGDDFDRNLWLIRVMDNERRLLTQGHKGEGFATHPHMSFSPDGKSIVFGSSRNGSDSVFLVDLPEDFESLPKP